MMARTVRPDSVGAQWLDASPAAAAAAAAHASITALPPRDEPAGGASPLLRAASALLRALAAIQCAEVPPPQGLRALHDRLAYEVVEFSRACDGRGVRHEHMLAARYALCTALDEALNCKPWAGGEQAHVGPWSQYALLQEFHQEGEGGKTVFLLIARLASEPQQHRDVLELMLHVLALGFMGDYRRRADGQQAIELLRQRLLELLGRQRMPIELAPPLAELAQPTASRLRALPGVLLGLVLGASLLGSAWSWSEQLGRQGARLQGQLTAMLERVEDGLRAPAVPASTPRAQVLPDLRAWLNTAIQAGQLQLLDEPGGWRIRFRGDDMFDTGSSALRPDLLPLLRQIGTALRDGQAQVLVIGHTDDTPPGAAAAQANKALSLRRAQQVAQQLELAGVAAARLQVLGRGSSEPVADNATSAGRARNRRVDIVLR